MKISIVPVIGSLLWLTIGSAGVAGAETCERDAHELLYQATSDEDKYNYWEQFPASPSTPVLIERLDSQGNIIWTAAAERGCSQGVGRCYLSLEYYLDGEAYHSFRIEMNYFYPESGEFLVFSHLREKITYAYFKSHPFDRFSFEPNEGKSQTGLVGEDFEIPNLFQKAKCD